MRILEAANAVDTQGRLLFETSSTDSLFCSTALFDPKRNAITRVPLRFEGDIGSPIWAPDGRIAAIGMGWVSSIWRYHPVKETLIGSGDARATRLGTRSRTA
jgi:hypothetical protein